MTPLSETFIFGVANSLHCAGMCGPLASCFNRGAAGTLGYHTARILAYSVLGGIAGSIGMVVGAETLPTHWLSIVMGAVLVAMVFGVSLALPTGKMPGFVTRLFLRAQRLPPFAAGAGIGALTPLLPCGVLYVAFGSALTAGTTADGAMTMGAFAVGSFPVLLLAQLQMRWLANHMSPRGRSLLFRGLMLVAAAVLIWRGVVAMQGSSCCGG